MKKLLSILCVLVAFYSNAQVTVQIGTGTTQNTNTTYPAPYGNWYWGAKHQFIIPASELYSAGIPGNIITGLAFDVVTVQGTPLQNFEIKMGHTSLTSLTNWVTTGLTSVYTIGTYTETTGWNNHVFGTPFIWNGADNIIIETCFNNSSYTNNAVVNQTATSYNSSIWVNNDVSTVCTSPNTPQAIMQRPNMQLSVIPSSSSDIDLGVTNINSPVDGCGLSASSTVSVKIINFGNNDTSNVNVSYTVDGGSAVTELITTTIPSHTSYIHTFATNASLTGSSHTISAYTSLAQDTVLSNDTTTITITDQSLTLPYIEDFETLSDETYSPWANGWSGDAAGFRWEAESGISGDGGPDMDHTTMTQNSGIYMYTEASVSTPGDSAMIVSPCVDLGSATAPTLTFWYHKFGNNMGDLFIDVYSYNTGTWTRGVDQILGQTHFANASSDPWTPKGVDLSAFVGEIISVRFRAASQGCCQGDMAIDDVKFWEPAPVTSNFTVTNYNPEYQESITFTDLSTSDPNSWWWDFGDGNTSTVQNPTHSYSFSGTKTVTLIASNGAWYDTTSQNLIVQNPPLRFSTDSLFFSIPCGDSVTASVTFYNDSVSPLGFEIVTDVELPLDSVLARVNRNYTDLTSLVPSLFLFTDGVTGDNISDGGNDMYDGGNRLNTNISGTGNIDYSDNVIMASTEFGPDGKYFTRKNPGLFVLAADLDNVSLFNITGNLGADGSGNSDGTILTSNLNGSTFTAFINRTYNAGDPSINRMIIVKDNPNAAHTYLTSTQDEDHEVTGLNTSSRLYYLLFAAQSGLYVADTDMQNILDQFVSMLDAPSYLTISPISDTISSGDSSVVNFTFNPTGLNSGVYENTITINNTTPPYATYYIYASIDVYGSAEMNLSGSCVNFGGAVVNETETDTLEILNVGCDTLVISGVSSNNSDYVLTPISSNIVVPGGSYYVIVDFTPIALGSSTGDILIQSNLPDTTVCLTGTGSNIVSSFAVSAQNNCTAAFLFSDNSPGSPTSWFWDFGDGNTSTQQNPTHLYVATGTYTVELIVCNSIGCDTSQTTVVAAFTFDYDVVTTGTLATGNSIDFTVAGNDIVATTWNFGDGSTFPGMNVSHTYSDSGTYIVAASVITSEPCSFIVYDTLTIAEGADGIENNESYSLHVFPNPSQGKVSLNLEGINGITNIEIYNSQGQKIYIENNVILKNHSLELDSKSGIYMVRILRDGITVVEKSIVITE